MKHERSAGGSSMIAGPLLAPRVMVPRGAASLLELALIFRFSSLPSFLLLLLNLPFFRFALLFNSALAGAERR
jgi:hypothetical protein